MLKGYADEHIPRAVTEALRRRGMDVVTVQERSQREADDDALLAQAFAEGRVMLTGDQDFLRLAAELARKRERFAPIFFWPQQRRSVGELVRRIISAGTGIDYDSACSRVFFL